VTESALDDINKQIIEHLRRDGRMPYAALAKTIGLSEADVRQHMRRPCGTSGNAPDVGGNLDEMVP